MTNTQSEYTVTTAMFSLQGQGVVRGFAIGRAVVLGAAALEVSHYRVDAQDVTAECQRLIQALATARDELQHLANTLPDDAPRELGPLLTVHSLLLDDPMLMQQTCDLISQKYYNAEWALTAQGQVLAEQFSLMEDDYLRERGADIRQVIERVLRVLSGSVGIMPTIDADSNQALIVVARDISPADMLRLRGARFSAFLTDLGGPTSHTAIVARSMNVPAVVGLGSIRSLVREGDMLIADGFSGTVLVNPSAKVLAEYQQRQEQYLSERAELGQLRDAPAVTLDGVQVFLEANIELPEEAVAAQQAGADGIGLFRSEFLFMGRANLPTEEEQYQAYAAVLNAMAGKPVTIRTLDLGADKTLDGEATVASNPALGLRAIRYCLANPDVFQTQLRALLRASLHGHVRILIPMVSTMQEVYLTKQALEIACRQLTACGTPYARNYSLGAMVEVPAMAIAIEPFAEALDFLSIGTNDLIQYTLAIDRGDSDVADMYDPMHPAVLRLISHVINVAERLGKPVSMCGEMAGDLSVTHMLLGLGLTRFSMHPQQMLDIKKEVRQAHSNALRTKVASALNRAERIDLASLG